MRRLFDYSSVPREKQTHILAVMLFGSVLCYLLMTRFLLTSGEVSGTSMLPTLQDGERYLINRLVYRWGGPLPGDIVEIRMPGSNDDDCVKRVIALPGDVVQIKDGVVHVNGRVLPEPYLPSGVYTAANAMGTKPYKLPQDVYFVLGDNRAVSADSRQFGGVKSSQLVGKVWLKFGG